MLLLPSNWRFAYGNRQPRQVLPKGYKAQEMHVLLAKGTFIRWNEKNLILAKGNQDTLTESWCEPMSVGHSGSS